MGRIALCTNPLDLREVEWFGWNGAFIDWLLREFPNGFPGHHHTRINGEPLAVADYDRVIGDGDQVVLLALPGDYGTIVTAVVTAIVSAAISYAINLIWPTPDGPKDAPAPASVYSLSTPTNQARLGQPIPAVYGSVLATPDLASQPYVWFEDNEQYLGILLCLGHGDFDISGIQISSTPFEQLPGSVAEHTVFAPADHGQAMGTIRGVTGIWENVDTTPEVGDQEIKAPYLDSPLEEAELTEGTPGTIVLPSAAPASVVAGDSVWIQSLDDKTKEIEELVIASISGDRLTLTLTTNVTLDPVRPVIRDVTEFTATGPTSFDATTYNRNDRLPDWVGRRVRVNMWGPEGDFTFTSGTATSTLVGPNWAGGSVTTTIDAVNGDVGLSRSLLVTMLADLDAATLTTVEVSNTDATPNDTANVLEIYPAAYELVDLSFSEPLGSVGPFAMCAPGARMVFGEFDVVFPGGLFWGDDDGDLNQRTVDLTFTLIPIDDDGVPIPFAAEVVNSEAIVAATNTPQRFSYKYAVPAGRYAGRVDRSTPPDVRVQDMSKTLLTGLKGYIEESTGPVYGDVTLISVKLKATDGIDGDAANHIGVRCTRKLDGVATVNPAEAFEDVVTNAAYGGGRPATELDAGAVSLLRSVSEGENGFNAIFDTRTTVWEALKAVCQVSNAAPMPLGALFSVVVDRRRSMPAWEFSEANIVRDSLRFSYIFDNTDAYDGYEVEYRDPDTWLAAYATWPADAVDAEQANLFGCSDADTALAYAERLWRRKRYRRKVATWGTELEGHLPQVGDLVRIAHRMLTAAEDYVITSIAPGEDNRVALEGYRYDGRVYQSEIST